MLETTDFPLQLFRGQNAGLWFLEAIFYQEEEAMKKESRAEKQRKRLCPWLLILELAMHESRATLEFPVL